VVAPPQLCLAVDPEAEGGLHLTTARRHHSGTAVAIGPTGTAGVMEAVTAHRCPPCRGEAVVAHATHSKVGPQKVGPLEVGLPEEVQQEGGLWEVDLREVGPQEVDLQEVVQQGVGPLEVALQAGGPHEGLREAAPVVVDQYRRPSCCRQPPTHLRALPPVEAGAVCLAQVAALASHEVVVGDGAPQQGRRLCLQPHEPWEVRACL